MFDPAVFQAIGLLMMMAVRADWMVTNHLLRMISGRRKIIVQAYPLITGTDFKVKINQYRILIMMHLKKDHETRTVITKMLDRLEWAYQRRNEIAHGVVAPHKNKNAFWLQTLRAKAKLGSFPPAQVVTLREVRKWTWMLYIYAEQLSGALDQLGFRRHGPRRKVHKIGSRKSSHRSHILRPKPKTPLP